MKKIMLFLLMSSCFLSLCGCEKQEMKEQVKQENHTQTASNDIQNSSSVLVVYFSRLGNTVDEESLDVSTSASILENAGTRTGTTAYVAQMIASRVDSTLLPIKVQEPYPSDFDALRTQNHNEIELNILPALIQEEVNLDAYDTIMIGYPVWASTIPQAIVSFLQDNDLSGKTIVPFCTHDGYGAGNSFTRIQELEPEANVLAGISLESEGVLTSENEIQAWLANIKLGQTAESSNKLVITIGNQTVYGELYHTALANEIKQKLPFTVTLGGYGGREYYGSLDFTPEASTAGQRIFENGDITYCSQNNTIAIFYAQTDSPNLTMDVQPIGRVTSDLSIFHELGSSAEVTFTLKEEK